MNTLLLGRAATVAVIVLVGGGPVRAPAVQTLTLDDIVQRAQTEATGAQAAALIVRERTCRYGAARTEVGSGEAERTAGA